MAFIRKKWHDVTHTRAYYWIVENYYEDGHVKQRPLLYIGSEKKLFDIILAAKGYGIGSAGEALADQENNGDMALPINPALSDLFIQTYSHGAGMSLFWTNELLGFEEMMDEGFTPKTIHGYSRARVLLLATLHRAIDPGSKREFRGWAEKTSLPYHLNFDASVLDSAAFWEAMDGITEEQIRAVWNRLIKKIMDYFGLDPKEYHLDYTNYFTYIDTRNGRCLICHRGHNKQKRDDLRQFSLACLTAHILRIPIVWDLYEGNTNDKTEFPAFIKSVKEQFAVLGIDPKDVTITFDGGSNSADNFGGLEVKIVCAHTLTSHKDLLDIPLEDYSIMTMTNGTQRKYYRVPGTDSYSGVEGIAVLTYSDELQEGQVAELKKDMENATEALKEINTCLVNPKSKMYTKLRQAEMNLKHAQRDAEDYNKQLEEEKQEREAQGIKKKGKPKKPREIPQWDACAVLVEIVSDKIYTTRKYLKEFTTLSVQQKEDGMYSAEMKVDEKQKEAYIHKHFGKKMIVSNHLDWSTEQILENYSSQECIENDIFRVSKDVDHFSVRPQFHWTDDKIRVHVFICMAALTLAEVFRMLAEQEGVKGTKCAMLDTLSGIRDGWIVISGNKPARFVEQLSEEEEQLWKVSTKIRDMVHPATPKDADEKGSSGERGSKKTKKKTTGGGKTTNKTKGQGKTKTKATGKK